MWSVIDGEFAAGGEDDDDTDTFGWSPNRVDYAGSHGSIYYIGVVYYQKAEYAKNPKGEKEGQPHEGWPFWKAKPKPDDPRLKPWSSGKDPDPEFLIPTGLSRTIYEEWDVFGRRGWARASMGVGVKPFTNESQSLFS